MRKLKLLLPLFLATFVLSACSNSNNVGLLQYPITNETLPDKIDTFDYKLINQKYISFYDWVDPNKEIIVPLDNEISIIGFIDVDNFGPSSYTTNNIYPNTKISFNGSNVDVITNYKNMNISDYCYMYENNAFYFTYDEARGYITSRKANVELEYKTMYEGKEVTYQISVVIAIPSPIEYSTDNSIEKYSSLLFENYSFNDLYDFYAGFENLKISKTDETIECTLGNSNLSRQPKINTDVKIDFKNKKIEINYNNQTNNE